MKKVLLIMGILVCSMFLFGCQVVSEDEEAAVAEIIAEEENVSEEEAMNLAGNAVETGKMKWLSCVDSDGGKDYETQGEATVKYLYKGNEKTRVRTDQCTFDGRVKEYYCKDTLRLAIDGYMCKDGCGNSEGNTGARPDDGCGNVGGSPLSCEEGACKGPKVEVQPPPGPKQDVEVQPPPAQV